MVAFLLEDDLTHRSAASANWYAWLAKSEACLWATPVRVSQQALSQRLTSLPSALFLQVLQVVLTAVAAAMGARASVPCPRRSPGRKRHYRQVCVQDGSTLDALIRQAGLATRPAQQPAGGAHDGLAGPVLAAAYLHLWYEADPQAHDQRCWPAILAVLKQGALLIFDLGYTNFALSLRS